VRFCRKRPGSWTNSASFRRCTPKRSTTIRPRCYCRPGISSPAVPVSEHGPVMGWGQKTATSRPSSFCCPTAVLLDQPIRCMPDCGGPDFFRPVIREPHFELGRGSRALFVQSARGQLGFATRSTQRIVGPEFRPIEASRGIRKRRLASHSTSWHFACRPRFRNSSRWTTNRSPHSQRMAQPRGNRELSQDTACWLAEWPNAACGSFSFIIEAGTSTTICPATSGCRLAMLISRRPH
jgi:hypothetical protein